MKVYGLPNCTTTQKAVAQLEASGHKVTFIDYRETPLSVQELQVLIERSGIEVQKWFNTSGQAYRDHKNELQALSTDEIIKRFASTPMLIKRPVIVSEVSVTVGLPKTK